MVESRNFFLEGEMCISQFHVVKNIQPLKSYDGMLLTVSELTEDKIPKTRLWSPKASNMIVLSHFFPHYLAY